LAMKEFIQKSKNNFQYRTVVNALLSAIITIAFVVYNGMLGLFIEEKLGIKVNMTKSKVDRPRGIK